MIVANGTLQTVVKTGGGMEHGKPIPVKEVVSDPIPCNIKTVTDNKKGKIIDNVFTQSSYEVLIDLYDVPCFKAETVILTDNRDDVIGKFQVQDVQHLDFIGAVKVTV